MSKKLETIETPLKTGRILEQKFTDKYKSILVYFLLIILFWVCFSLGESKWPHKVSYAFHESFYVPVNIGLFLIPIIAFIMIFDYLIKVARKENTKQNMVRLLYVSAIIITHIILLRYVFSYTTTSGYAVIEEKVIDEDVCYIYVNNGEYSTRLKCAGEVYDQLVVDESLAYRIEYKWSGFTPEKGRLIEIIPKDVIDNR